MVRVNQCWWRICLEINVFFFCFEYHMFYVLYPFVIYLLTCPRIFQVSANTHNEVFLWFFEHMPTEVEAKDSPVCTIKMNAFLFTSSWAEMRQFFLRQIYRCSSLKILCAFHSLTFSIQSIRHENVSPILVVFGCLQLKNWDKLKNDNFNNFFIKSIKWDLNVTFFYKEWTEEYSCI
jgi:predicted small metal-binding protein